MDCAFGITFFHVWQPGNDSNLLQIKQTYHGKFRSFSTDFFQDNTFEDIKLLWSNEKKE